MGDRAVAFPLVQDITIPPVWVGPRNLLQPVILALLGGPAPELGREE